MTSKRETVPPMRPRGVDVLVPPVEPASGPPAPAHVKTSYYLRADQMVLLDAQQAAFRKAGQRTVNASMLMRAALDLAERHQDEWDELVAEAAR